MVPVSTCVLVRLSVNDCYQNSRQTGVSLENDLKLAS